MTTRLRMAPALRIAPALFLALGLAGVVAAAVFPRLELLFLDQTARRNEATLRLAVEGLTGALERFRPIPALIAERPLLVRAIKDPSNQGVLPYVNEQLRQTAFRIGASDVYLMDISGLTIAASSYRKARSFVGQNFGYRPYFMQALEGGIGQFAALGTTSGERGYFIAAPVLEDSRIVGVVAVKFTVDEFETAWQGAGSEIMVRDLNGIVFMASRPDWHFRTTEPLDAQARDWIERTRQYPLDRVRPMTFDVEAREGLEIVTVGDDAGPASYLIQSQRVPEAGWTISILVPTAMARAEALWALAAGVLALALAGLLTAIILQRRARIEERLRAQAAAQELAEEQVELRTAELNSANARLTREVEERRAAEVQLRQTQAELVQAGKLAALGQMSAALSHEINQPLAAVKSYAENAATFLDRGRKDEARDNVTRISEMADRMSAISRHLRNFARRPQDRLGPIPVLSVIDDAVALMASRLKSTGTRLDFARPEREIWVTGGAVRLQQVIVNLLSNAIDAMEGTKSPKVAVSLVEDGSRVAVVVRDSGPGMDEETLAKVFDPFFSTKTHGGGLGLGLSISYNIVRDFGGTLSARNHPEGGAEFRVDLAAAESPGLVAE